MPRPVTTGLNGSPESAAAAEWAAREALRRGAPLRLVHVWDRLPHVPPTLREPDVRHHWADRLLGGTAAELETRHPGLEIVTAELEEEPAPAMVAAAAESELLVLGSRGLSGLTGFLVGSVALSTVAHAERPVVLVRALDREAAESQRDVLLGLDARRPCDPVIEFAFEAAALRSAALRAVYTWSLPPIYGYHPGTVDPRHNADLGVQEARAFTRALGPWRAEFPGVEVREQILTGRAGHELVRAAADADLLVVGRRTRRRTPGTHLGPVAHAVLHHAVCPVAVVPHD